jgi:hypothetical protein
MQRTQTSIFPRARCPSSSTSQIARSLISATASSTSAMAPSLPSQEALCELLLSSHFSRRDSIVRPCRWSVYAVLYSLHVDPSSVNNASFGYSLWLVNSGRSRSSRFRAADGVPLKSGLTETLVLPPLDSLDLLVSRLVRSGSRRPTAFTSFLLPPTIRPFRAQSSLRRRSPRRPITVVPRLRSRSSPTRSGSDSSPLAISAWPKRSWQATSRSMT